MQQQIFNLVRENLKNPKLYVGLFAILIVGMLLFPYIDANYFYYNRVEKRIDILDKVTNIDQNKINKSHTLTQEYESILTEVSKQKAGSLGSVFMTNNSDEVKVKKFLTGAILSWLVGILCVFIKMEKKWYKLLGFIFFAIIGCLIGYIGMILPTVISPTCNYVVFPILQCLVFGILITSGNKNKK